MNLFASALCSNEQLQPATEFSRFALIFIPFMHRACVQALGLCSTICWMEFHLFTSKWFFFLGMLDQSQPAALPAHPPACFPPQLSGRRHRQHDVPGRQRGGAVLRVPGRRLGLPASGTHRLPPWTRTIYMGGFKLNRTVLIWNQTC